MCSQTVGCMTNSHIAVRKVHLFMTGTDKPGHMATTSALATVVESSNLSLAWSLGF